MASPLIHGCRLLLLFLLFSGPLLALSAIHRLSDTDALFVFRQGADAHGNLVANWSTTEACSGRWRGVQCSGGRVTSLALPYLDLRGPLDPLASLDQLRLLDLHGNRLNGTLVSLLASLPNLKLLYLSHNDLTGEIPTSVGLLSHLLRLDLSDNNLRGPIPGRAVANLTRLLTLRLQNNLLSGNLPDLSTAMPVLKEFNASNNELYGEVPEDMRIKFGVTAFAGNAGLCGSTPPMPLCTSVLPHTAPSRSSSSQAVVPSNTSSMPPGSSPRSGTGPGEMGVVRVTGTGALSNAAIAGIFSANALFLMVTLSLFLTYCCCARDHFVDKEYKRKINSGGDESNSVDEGEKQKIEDQAGRIFSDGEECSDEARQNKLVFFEEDNDEDCYKESSDSSGGGNRAGMRKRVYARKRFEIEELLRASAEMLGKGNLGTVYRAVLEDGCMVAVKRLKDANPCPRKDFHRYMDLIGRLHHPNLVRLRAYYYAKQEKLLIYDYLPNASLYFLLHGNRGQRRIPLDWTTRLSLLLGAARGLACIHEEYNSSKIPHGNIKSSNVLIDRNGVACLSDFGLALLLDPALSTVRLGGYRAPEQADMKRLSQEADVYSFGVLILEVLTGRAPAQYPSPPPPPSLNGRDKTKSAVAQGIVNLSEWVRSVVREEWTAELFDAELLRYKNTEEMVAMLHVGLACVALQPEQRPRMSDVVKMIEDIELEQSPFPEDELDESRASLSLSLATTPVKDARLSF